ncbi:MAG: hypothetical protein AAB600_03195 [Patescibacteria group bacterium]
MTIKRISYPNGKALPLDVPAAVSLGQFVLKDRNLARDVPEGECDITPAGLTKDVYGYSLKVNEDGSGVLEMTVKDTDDAREARKVRPTEDRTIRIPQDKPSFALVGPKKDNP